MRRRLIFSVAGCVLVLSASACGFFKGDDGLRQLGRKTVIHEFDANGTAMLLVAYPSDAGLCVETQNAEPPENAGGGCGFPVPDEELLSVGTDEFENAVIVSGPVAKDVANVTVQVNGAEVDAGPLGANGAFGVNFFVAAFPANAQVNSVTATDADGRVLEKDQVDS